MKTLKMLVEKEGSEDGVKVKTFGKGKVYSIVDPLADVFLDQEWAMIVEIADSGEIMTPENMSADQAVRSLEKMLYIDPENLTAKNLKKHIATIKKIEVDPEKFAGKTEHAKSLIFHSIEEYSSALDDMKGK